MATQEKQILESAKDIALSTETWADLSNALFDPEEGLVAKAYPTREQRASMGPPSFNGGRAKAFGKALPKPSGFNGASVFQRRKGR